ncbi:MAG: hydrogenase maturation nickel metallochaperone HypA [Candidatus Methanomethylophilaceae archaeon]|nr:hydrogenase maturation nickel metallochaperone HypA [Candidatus Methanomethylophilaceae archaeon]NLF33546.1 hydrogenase maturation nickel metallochaperone HypA [Thermoplasmatales archaeon]
MHEVAVVSEIVRAILAELEDYSVASVQEVDLLIGDMTSLGEEQLSFAYEIVTQGTVLEGSLLSIRREEVRISCGPCGFEGPAESLSYDDYAEHSIPILSCPLCKGPVKVTAGQSCRVVGMRFEEA